MKIIEEGLLVANELEFGIVDGVISMVIMAENPSRIRNTKHRDEQFTNKTDQLIQRKIRK